MSALNPRQREAVRHGDGPLLILAGAGTGKTRTLACRIAHLVERGVPADEILAVAFTNKSAGELRERVQRLLGKRTRAPHVSTFHSFCVRVLRQEIERIGFRSTFTIYDTADQLSVIREVAKEVSLDGRSLDVKRLQWLISSAKNEGRSPDPGDGGDEYALMAARLYPRYQEALRAYNAVDFDDLLLFTLTVFSEHPDALSRWKARCRHILVDEFQDTNVIQYRLVSLLAAPEGNLTVVGDDDQSIYGWRGALPGNITGFTADWSASRVVTLDQNYRSTTAILSAANAVISRNPGRREKNLWSDLGRGEPVRVLTLASAEDEAAAVVEEIGTLVWGGRARLGECAVIFRTNAQSRPFEDALRGRRLPYVVVGGLRFYDRKEVRDLLAYLSFVFNPRDEVSLLRIINYPARGIGRETVLRLQEESRRRRVPLAEAAGAAGDIEGIGPRQVRSLAALSDFFIEARSWFTPGRLAAAAGDLVRETGLEEAVRRSVKEPEAAERRVENLREVVSALVAFEAGHPGADLGDYLSTVNLAGRDEADSEAPGEAVTLLTAHAAKGLEYDHVFLAGMEEGLLPHQRSIADPGGLEEERRLAYVGMTRARRTLVLTHARARSRWAAEVRNRPSRFLGELPEEVVFQDRSGAWEPEPDPEAEERLAEEFFDTWSDG